MDCKEMLYYAKAGKLPEECWHEPSELVASLRARLVREGFDEAAIIRRILDDEFADALPAGFTA